MKKKLMMVALLLAGLSMGACVDDKESASVTAVRDAKTEQLESVAAMNSAAAQARQATAAAEAALKLAEAQAKQAQAELQKANAEYERKQAELQELRNQQESIDNKRKQALLEQELAQIEVRMKQIEQQMAQIKADMEEAEIKAQTALINAQAQLNRAKQSLLNYEKYLASAKTEAERRKIQAERDHLTNLANDYTDAVRALNTAKSDLNSYKRQLITAENDLTTLNENKEADIAKYKSDIALKQIQIEALKKYANYTENLDSLSLAYYSLYQQKEAASENYSYASNAYYFYQVTTDVIQELETLVYDDVLYNLALDNKLVDEEGELYVKSDQSTFVVPSQVTDLHLLNVINPYRWQQTKSLAYTYTSEDGDYSQTESWGLGDSLYIDIEINEDLRKFELDIEELLATNKQNYENATTKATKLQRLYNGKPTEADWKDGGSATKTCANMVDSTLILKAAYDKAAEADKATAKTAYETQLTKEQQCKEALENAINEQADAKLEQDCFNKVVDIIRNFDKYYAAFQTKITARNEQSLKDYSEKVSLWIELATKDYADDVATANFIAVSTIYVGSWEYNPNTGQFEEILDGASTIADKISTLEGEIKDLEDEIEDISDIEDKEVYIETLKARIEYQEQKVKVAEINAANAKAALEEALAKYSQAEE